MPRGLNSIKLCIIASFFSVAGLFSFPAVTLAQSLPAGYKDTVTVDPVTAGYKVNNLSTLLTSAAAWVIGIGALILFVYLVWGGVEWIISGGEKSRIEAGRTKITQSIIGFAILACVFIIYSIALNFLGLSSLIKIPGVNLSGTGAGGGGGTVNTMTCNASTLNQTFNDGGAGGYCTGAGSATVKCVASYGAITYPHFEPCSCTTSLKQGVSTAGCQ